MSHRTSPSKKESTLAAHPRAPFATHGRATSAVYRAPSVISIKAPAAARLRTPSCSRSTARPHSALRAKSVAAGKTNAAAVDHPGRPKTAFSDARQMKTINFALSSRKCLEDGWTVTNYLPPPKTPDPILYDSDTQSHPLPNLPIPWQQDAGGLLIKKYTNGTPFLTLLGDGTGTCYYPSGCAAIVITLEQPNIFTYYVLSDSDTSPKLMAVLSQRGRCVVYHDNKGLLYHSSPLEGSLFNKEGQRTKHWEWDAFSPHVHAPPFQPICFQMSNYLAMRCVSLEQQSLVFQYKRFTFRCAVGSRSKKLARKPQPTAQYVMYMDALDQTRAKINANLRQLNDAISTVQDISKREVTTERIKKKSPSDDTRTRAPTSIAVNT